jgi:hypothetical protein
LAVDRGCEFRSPRDAPIWRPFRTRRIVGVPRDKSLYVFSVGREGGFQRGFFPGQTLGISLAKSLTSNRPVAPTEETENEDENEDGWGAIARNKKRASWGKTRSFVQLFNITNG